MHAHTLLSLTRRNRERERKSETDRLRGRETDRNKRKALLLERVQLELPRVIVCEKTHESPEKILRPRMAQEFCDGPVFVCVQVVDKQFQSHMRSFICAHEF